MKLRTKIQLFSSVIMLVFILLINASIYYFFYKTSAENELEQLDSQMETIISTINANPDIAKNKLLRAYVPNDGMIRVIDSSNNILITVTKHSEYTKLPIEFTNEEIHTIESIEKQADAAVVAQPVIWGNGNVVTLQVAKYLTGLENTMQTLLYVVIAASIIMLLPTLLAGRVLSRFILKPIQALIQTMETNKKKDEWHKIPVRSHSKDELYQMERTFNEMIDHLRVSFAKQEQFVSDASHELKTPIAIVKSYAQLLERRGRERPEIYQESIHAIETEADRMQSLVEQLLFLAKSKQETAFTNVDITNLCEDIVSVFKGAYERLIRINNEYETIRVHANEGQLRQVIYILLENACKYSDDEIILTIDTDEENVLIKVQDFGQGIPAEEQDKIFDRFYRIDKARSRDNGGTGLGLAIAKSIVASHEGELFVSSKWNEGSTFTVKLPIVKEH